MIRRNKLGKRILALLLCGTLTFTSVTPAMAAESSGIAEDILPEENTTTDDESEDLAEKNVVDDEEKESENETVEKATEGATAEKETTGQRQEEDTGAPKQLDDVSENMKIEENTETPSDEESDETGIENDITVMGVAEASDDNLLKKGHNQVTIKAGENSVTYKFTVPETSAYKVNIASDIHDYDIYDADGNRVNRSWGLAADGWCVNYPSWNKGEVYTFCFKNNNLSDNTGDFLFDVFITSVPYVKKIEISSAEKSFTVWEGEKTPKISVLCNIIYTDDTKAVDQNMDDFGNNYGLYGDRYCLMLKSSTGDKYATDVHLTVGDYNIIVCDYDTKDELAVCKDTVVHVTSPKDYVAGELNIGENTVVTSQYEGVGLKYYYTFTPKTSGRYCFSNISTLTERHQNNGQWEKSSELYDTAYLHLSAGTTYYFCFDGSDPSGDDDVYRYTINLSEQVSGISKIESASGKKQYFAYCEGYMGHEEAYAFRDWVIRVKDNANTVHELKIEDLEVTDQEDGKYYLSDASTGIEIRYEVYKDGKKIEYVFGDNNEPGTYTLVLYANENDEKGSSYTVMVKEPSLYDWTGFTLSSGKNQFNGTGFYKFTAHEDGIYALKAAHGFWCEYYVFDEKEKCFKHYSNQSNYDSDSDTYEEIFYANANTSYYIYCGYANENVKKFILEEYPTVVKARLSADNRTNRKIIAGTGNDNSAGCVMGEFTYSDGRSIKINIGTWYDDDKGNTLTLGLKNDKGHIYSFDDAVPAGTYTVIIRCNDKEIPTENSYTVTAATLDEISPVLKEGDNTITAGWVENESDILNCAHLYRFTPEKTAIYHFTPATQIAVYIKNEDGILEHQKTYGKSDGTSSDLTIKLSQNITYYFSLTGAIKEGWTENYSWTMQLSAGYKIKSAKIKKTLPMDTFYTGGETKKEIESAIREAVEQLEVTYDDGTIGTEKADRFEVDYPDEFWESGQYKLGVRVWIQGEMVDIDDPVSITLLDSDDALTWDVSQPLTTSYADAKVKPGQALLYKMSGVKVGATYTISSRSDVKLAVSVSGGITETEDVETGSLTWYMFYMYGDECYVWIKPPADVSTVEVTAHEEADTDNVTVQTRKTVLYDKLDLMEPDDIQMTFTTSDGRKQSRHPRYEDDLCVKYPNGEVYYVFNDDGYLYRSFDEAGIYTFVLHDKEEKRHESGTFEVKKLDETALNTLHTDEVISLSDELYLFTPQKDGVYTFCNAENGELHPEFTYYDKKNERWKLCAENKTSAELKAGRPYIFRLNLPDGMWKLTTTIKKDIYGDLTPVKNISFSNNALYYDVANDTVKGSFTVEYADKTSREMCLEDINCNKYLDYTIGRAKDTLTLYLRYRTDENGEWTDCIPQVFATTLQKKVSLNESVSIPFGTFSYEFTPTETSWYEITTGCDDLMAVWKTKSDVCGGNVQYIKQGETCFVLTENQSGVQNQTLKVCKTDAPVSIQIENAASYGMAYNVYDKSFTLNPNEIRIKVSYAHAEKVLTGTEFRKMYGDSITVAKQSDTMYHIVVCIPDTTLTDTYSFVKAEAKNVYTSDATGTLLYTAHNGFRGCTGNRVTKKGQIADVFTFRPKQSGLYIMSIDDGKGDKKSACGSIYREDGILVVDHTQSNLIYLEKDTTYYQVMLYDRAVKSTLKLTPYHQQKECEHVYASSVTKATCTKTGVITYVCRKCGDTRTEILAVDKSAHTVITVLLSKAATCTSTGLTEGKKCNDCGTVIEPQKTINALGHKYGSWTTTKAATAVATGVQTRTCVRCNHKETRAIAKLAATGTLNATNFPLKVKQTAVLRVSNMAAGDRVVSWTSTDTKTATVDGAGKVTGKKKGKTTVTATLASGRRLTATVNVQTGSVKTTAVTVNTRNVTLSQNQSFQLVSVIVPFTSKDKISYKTSNKKIVTVSKTGKIIAKKAGKATITVKAGKKSVKVTVNVLGVKTTAIRVSATQLNLKVKKKATLKAYVTPGNSSEKVTWKSSNKKVATVDAKGKVTAKKAGTATITATSGSKSANVTVTVTK